MPVVEATAVFVNTQSDLGRRVEQAMMGALMQAQAEGLTDADAIKSRMLAARDGVLASPS